MGSCRSHRLVARSERRDDHWESQRPIADAAKSYHDMGCIEKAVMLLTLKVDPMLKGISIADKAYTFPESVRLLARAISLIDGENEEAVFSIADILYLLRSVNAHVPGELKSNEHILMTIRSFTNLQTRSLRVSKKGGRALLSEEQNIYRNGRAIDIGRIRPYCFRHIIVNY